jgi:Flp pilus assembly protein TadG
MRKRLIASLWSDTEGSVLIEATVLVPVLFTLMYGLFEFSWYFQKQQLVEIGIRDAARYLARVNAGNNDGNPCNNTTSVAQAQNIAVTGVTSGGTARVSGWTVGNVTITCPGFDNSGGSYSGASTIYLVTATTSFTDPAFGFFGILGFSTPNLSASHTERSIGPG